MVLFLLIMEFDFVIIALSTVRKVSLEVQVSELWTVGRQLLTYTTQIRSKPK